MSYRHQCLAVIATGVAGLVLGSWLLGTHTPNALVLLIGAALLALLTTQGMLVAILVIASRRARASAENHSR